MNQFCLMQNLSNAIAKSMKKKQQQQQTNQFIGDKEINYIL